MAFNPTQNTQQAILLPGTSLRGDQTAVQLELFDREGNAFDLSNVLERLDQLENPEG